MTDDTTPKGELLERDVNEMDVIEQLRFLATIPIPPDGTLRSSFLSSVRFRAAQAAMRDYNGVIREYVDSNTAFREVLDSIELLNNAPKVHKINRLRLDLELIEVENQLAQAKHQKKLHDRGREDQEKFVEQNELQDADFQLTQEDKEMVDAFLAKIKPVSQRALLEQALADQYLTGEDEAKARVALETILSQS